KKTAIMLLLSFSLFFSLVAIYPFQVTVAENNTMNFTTGEIITFHSTTEMSFWSGTSMTFTSGIIVQFIEVVNSNGVLEPCDVIQIVFPPGFIMEQCSWWEVLDQQGNPTGIEFHIDSQYGPNEFHIDMVWPGPIPLPNPGGVNKAEKKISKISPCDYFVVHWPSGWYPAPCSWWEIINPETRLATGFEFHVDWTNESCEFHVDQVIPGPYILPFPWHQIEARKKITRIDPCNWFVILEPAGFQPMSCSWWELLDPNTGEPTGLEFHIDQVTGGGAFHVDQTHPSGGFTVPMSYTVRVRQKITTIEPCGWFEVDSPATTPEPCTWWRIIDPEMGDVEFHVDDSYPNTGKFHIDEVFPNSMQFSPRYQLSAEKKIVGLSPCDWFKVKSPQGFLPTTGSWWRVTWPNEWASVTFHVDSTDGVNRFHIDNVPQQVPNPPTPPPWNVTAEEFTPPSTWYWKPNQVDYAPSGVPDFDQRQGGTYPWKDQWGAWSHCGPVAVANSLWWLDSEFEPNPTPPPTVNDGFPLVQTYGQWDDHDPLNVPWLVEHLAFLMDTDGRRTALAHSGTNVHDMEAGLAHYLSWTGVNPKGDVNGDGVVDQLDENIVLAAMGSTPVSPNWNLAADIFPASVLYPPAADNIIDINDLTLVQQNMGMTGFFYEHTVMQPDFLFIEEEVEKCQDVVLLVGYWIFDEQSGQWYREPGGHYVTVAGVDSTNLKLALSDPVQDAFESGLIMEGRMPVPHVHPPPEPPYVTHNNAQYVSQDIYNVAQIAPMWPPCPGGNWMIINFASWRPVPPYFAVIESAVVTSPRLHDDLAVVHVTTSKQGCKPVPTIGQNYTLKISVTVENQGDRVVSFFDVYVEISIGSSPPITIGSFEVESLGVGENTTCIFNWDTTGAAFGNYTVTGVVETVPGETETEDNHLNNVYIFVTLPGDIDGNLKVQLADLVILAKAYGSKLGDPKWNPNADMDGSGIVGLSDLVVLAKNYGKSYP
ncbi:MAG: CARDB domain-containing protein, partial [Candidatus Bathyarchaeia archaeon]